MICHLGMSDKLTALVRIIHKIPIFRGLSRTELNAVIKLCKRGIYKQDDVLCNVGTPSREMYILLSGELRIVTKDGLRVATVKGVNTVGEMGFMTRQPRSATVIADEPSSILIVGRTDFDDLLKEQLGIKAKLLENVIENLSTKVMSGNVQIHDLLISRDRYEARIAQLEKESTSLMRILEERCNMSREEAVACVQRGSKHHEPVEQ